MQREVTAVTSADIRRMALGYRHSVILYVACKYRVFDLLASQPRTSIDLAEELQVNTEGIELLLNVLAMLGLVRKDADRYSNTETSTRFLVSNSADYQGGYVAFAFDRIQMWLKMEERIKNGHPSSDFYEAMVGGNPEKTEHFMAAMHANAIPNARFIVSHIDFSKCQRILDVGGGTGIYSTQLAQKYAQLSADIIDLEPIIPITKKYLEREHVENRVRAMAGDYCKAESYGRGYDAVLMMAIIHQEPPATLSDMFRYANQALSSRGFLIASTFFLDEDRMGPPFSVMFGLDLFLGTPRGKAYTPADIIGLLKDAGFQEMEHVPIVPGPEGIGVVIARKE